MQKKCFTNKEGKSVEITFSEFCEGDEEGLKSCIVEYYGNGYPYMEYFEPGYLSEGTASGRMLVICGKIGDGTIVSTIAMFVNSLFPGSGVLSLRTVREDLRGFGIGSFQEDMLFELIEERKERLKISSLFAEVMMDTLVSQNSLGKRGFILCGMQPMIYNADKLVPGAGYDRSLRLSMAVMVRGNLSSEERTMFVPEEESAIINKIYSDLGADIRKNNDIPSPVIEKTAFTVDEQEIHSSSVYIIEGVGKDFEELIENKKTSLSAKEDPVFIVYLNLRSPGADTAYNTLKAMGFAFTGMKPLNTDAEYIIMSHTYGKALDTRCVVLRGQDRALFDLIKTNIQSRSADK